MRRSLLVPLLLAGAAIFAAFGPLRSDSRSGPDATVGTAEVVFRWQSDACERLHFPDSPARAFRIAGNIRLSISHYETRFMVGPNFDDLRVSCDPAFSSSAQSDPRAYNDHEWLTAFYVLDRSRVIGLVHNEFHGHIHGPCRSKRYWFCWYNAITAAVSTDAGRTFEQPRPPGHVVAAPSHEYIPDIGPTGVFSPSNIFRQMDHLYFLARRRDRNGEQGVCIFRTSTPSDPSSWRAWDGRQFDEALTSPYEEATRKGDCEFVSPGQLGHTMRNSVVWSHALRQFVVVGLSDRSGTWGIHYSVSDDLFEWSSPRLLLRSQRAETYRCGGAPRLEYPSLIDPQSDSLSYDTMGRSAFLYFTRFNYPTCRPGALSPRPGHDRDLVRVPVHFAAAD